MLGKRKSSRPIAPFRKRRKGAPPVEEITFDFTAREEYLTGFHKRKLQRIKHAKEEAQKKEREEKVAARKVLRESRRIEREKHVEAVNAAVRNAEGLDVNDAFSDSGSAQWNGIEEDAKGVDHEDDYLDDDRHTVVTVEAVNFSHDGLQRIQDSLGPEDEGAQLGGGKLPDGTKADGKTVDENSNRSSTTQSQTLEWRSKKKKKFRYESKAQRKATRFKEKMGSKAKARARRG